MKLYTMLQDVDIDEVSNSLICHSKINYNIIVSDFFFFLFFKNQ